MVIFATIVKNTDPVSCPEGFTQSLNAEDCEGINSSYIIHKFQMCYTHLNCAAIKPKIELVSDLEEIKNGSVVNIGLWQVLKVECISSGGYPGKVEWRKNEQLTSINITEVNMSNIGEVFKQTTNPAVSKEIGQVYAYKYSDTKVELGTGMYGLFHAAVGISEIANGTYECFAENNNASSWIKVHINVTGRNIIYYLNTLSFEFIVCLFRL